MRPRLLARLNAGEALALVSDAGTPLVSDPGYRLVTEAISRKISVEAVPGASAVLAGLSVSGLPSDRFLFAGRPLVLFRFDGLTAWVKRSRVTAALQVPRWNGGRMPLSTLLSSAILDLVDELAPNRGTPRSEIRFVTDRPGHDRRYAIDSTRIETELGWEFIQIYGLTETTPLVTMNRRRAEIDDLSPADRAAKLSRAGAPALGVQVRISPDGEVLARGNHVMQGYWDQPQATADAIHPASDDPTGPDWFHTGDGGTIDDEYYVTISDRKKDVIISGGENVSSIEVEDALFSHPEVAEVCVIGVPDEKWGELVLGLVVTTPGSALDEATLIAYVKTKLAGYKCPKRIEFRTELARTATGKLQKFKLREPYWAGRARGVN